MRTVVRFAFVLLLALAVVPAFAFESITQNFDHKLAMNAQSQSWEHRIALPDDWAQRGLLFIRRQLTVSGKLQIVREELKANYYYVQVRLVKSFWGSKGAVSVTIDGDPQMPAVPEIAAPTGLGFAPKSHPLAPTFKWNGSGKYAALTLFDTTDNQTVWERVAVNGTTREVDEGSLKAYHHYRWAVKDGNDYGRYSKESQAGFRIDVRNERCISCNGMGYTVCPNCGGSGHIVSQGPNGTPVYHTCSNCMGTGRKQCPFCQGTGTQQVPVAIPE